MFHSGFADLGLGDFYCLFEDDPANDRVAMWRRQGSVVGEVFTCKKKNYMIIVESGSCGSIFQGLYKRRELGRTDSKHLKQVSTTVLLSSQMMFFCQHSHIYHLLPHSRVSQPEVFEVQIITKRKKFSKFNEFRYQMPRKG